jgi:Catalase
MTTASKPLAAASALPIRYDPSMEQFDGEEAQTTRGLVETITKIQATVYEDTRHASRGVHAKGQGIVVGELRVLENLPPELAQGLFARRANFPVVMRFSTIPGDLLDDNVSVPRGVAVKVIGVPGARVEGSEGDASQDFLFANGPVFAKSHPKGFLSTLKLLAGTTDKAPGLKKALSFVMRGVEKAIEAVGGQSATALTLGGYPEVHILGDDFFSQAPILYGDYIAKVALKPASANVQALAKAPVDLKGKPDGIREAVTDFFATHSAEWNLQIQLCTDLETMPIEDAAKPWPEDRSPYRTVARLTFPAQNAWSPKRVQQVNEEMSFSPWHALAAHRPLGAIMRVRKQVYAAAAQFRAQHNQVSIREPRSIEDIKD